ncbi:PAS/PAC sensor signal transduction histidine kinase [Desulfocicer vacuolatum DSM 3385]|uniref:histidine kinase n=1 Tax=Desulfocicer vacuolatum DSM 3385 TaxID=1121400 RepID=A0A1W1ZUI3_9BACT|nr:ATP-binding protein [Desulfocicer vacuolatum]SMC51738.1 PAS/PAC sensor signal transduction histidine kinase [Desulfocicer vacuolatum DSM 3385]
MTDPHTFYTPPATDNTQGKSRLKKELGLMGMIIVLVGILTFAETRITDIGEHFPISNAVLVFILINTNLLLLLSLILLVFRNLAKLYYEKKNKLFGTRFKTKLVLAFVTLALLPTTVLFYFSIHFISRSLTFWFDVPVEQTLDTSLTLGRQVYDFIEDRNLFFATRAAYHIESQELLSPEKSKDLNRYIQVLQRAFNLHGVEIYAPDAKRLALSLTHELGQHYFGILTSNELLNFHGNQTGRSIVQNINAGEIVRTISRIPVNGPPEKTLGFLVTTTVLPRDISQSLVSISQGTDSYRQLKMLKKPIQWSNYMALSIVALLAVFCAVWFGFYLARSITIPLMKFAEGTKRVTRGDLNYQIDFTSDDEIGILINSFNSMTRELAMGNEKLALSEKKMRQQNLEIEKSRQYMEVVLKNISAGVISVDASGTITTINKAAEAMLGISSDQILGKNFRETLEKDHLKLAEKISHEIPRSLNSMAFPLSITINGSPKHFAAHFNALQNEQQENMGAVMVFDDITELEKAQRMAAWREVARRIAHEVKNPLTPIKLSAQRLKRKYSKQINETIFDQCTEMIVQHVDLIRNLVNEFATFAKFPDTLMKPCDLEALIIETVALYREGLEHVSFIVSIAPDLPALNLDRQQMKQAFINLIDNAVSAIHKSGSITIDVSLDTILKRVRIEVSDTGKGISDQEKTRLFEPYFSTKKSGMGLGLAIVNSIISDHDGMIRVKDNAPLGATFIIELPVNV